MPSFQFNFSINNIFRPRALSRRSTALLLLFGLTLLLIHLGDTRVLTRHEVFAAQPGREMLHFGDLRHWMLPMLAGAPREAKPPGMMWLIAISIYLFRSQAEWVARLPSALAAMAVALMIARLAGRWFGDRIGRLAGLLQLSFVYTLTQAKLAEADMCLVAVVCAAMCSLAVAVIDSPLGLDSRRKTRITFWLAIAAAFLLKGPIGPLFIFLATVTFAIVRRRALAGANDWRVLKFVADPIGIVACLAAVIAWPLIAWRIDPHILHSWISEMAGTANGAFEREPFYYYLWSVPVMMLPWTPLAIIGLVRGPNAELSGSVSEQAGRTMLWRFLICWFIPGILFLSLAMKMKHHHYSMPLLPPLTIPAALGLDYYVRRQMTRRQGLIWPFFLGACVAGGIVVKMIPQVPSAMKPPIIALIAILAIGGMASLEFERRKRPALMIAGYLLTAWAIGVGVQSWVMPAQDDFKFQADFARAANAAVPPGDIVYMLGHREEEQEAQYAYYLRFPMQRLLSADDFRAAVANATGPTYAIAPAGFLPELSGLGQIQTITQCTGLRVHETEADRLLLLRVSPTPSSPITHNP